VLGRSTGAIVHISSQSSSTAIRERCAYSLSKAGVDYLTKVRKKPSWPRSWANFSLL
jgi:NAD(P)-dependent dehydrogenase (short-subunit alcohol dehydrogenase family)